MKLPLDEPVYRTMALALVPALVTSLLVQACSAGSDAVAQAAPVAETADPVEGLWQSVITSTDCGTGNPLGTFRGMNMVHRGGTVSDTNFAPPSTRGLGFGSWRRNGAGPTYTVVFQFARYNPDGTFAGMQRVTRNLTLSADGNSTTSNNTAEQLDPAGNVTGRGCATDVSTRAS